MNLQGKLIRTLILSTSAIAMTACAYNPFVRDNHTTGSVVSTAVGAGVGGGVIALLGGNKTLITLGALGGGAVGYYLSTLRNDAGPIIESGGDVYILGEYMGIYIPTDKLFEPNTADLMPLAPDILDSTAKVLKRMPASNNILISGNTSGFSRPRWELKLSSRRAKVVAAYLWTLGISHTNYIGYGNYFPVASDLTNKGIRMNSRIQITSYPIYSKLSNVGQRFDGKAVGTMHSVNNPCDYGRC